MPGPKRFDFTARKSVHIHIDKKFHGAFRTVLLSFGLTMQDALEECAVRISQNDKYMEKMLNDIIVRKAAGELCAAKEEIESIYELIEKDIDIDKKN